MVAEAGVGEDGGVVGDDVDAAELCKLAKLFRIHLPRVYPLVA